MKFKTLALLSLFFTNSLFAQNSFNDCDIDQEQGQFEACIIDVLKEKTPEQEIEENDNKPSFWEKVSKLLKSIPKVKAAPGQGWVKEQEEADKREELSIERRKALRDKLEKLFKDIPKRKAAVFPGKKENQSEEEAGKPAAPH